VSANARNGAILMLASCLHVGTIAAQPVSQLDQSAVVAALSAFKLDSLCRARTSYQGPCGTILVDTTVHFARAEWGGTGEPFDSVIGSLPATVFPIHGRHFSFRFSGEKWQQGTTLLKAGVARDSVQPESRVVVAIDVTPGWGFPGWIACVSLSRISGTWRVHRIVYTEE
jgi:hypothetical protein